MHKGTMGGGTGPLSAILGILAIINLFVIILSPRGAPYLPICLIYCVSHIGYQVARKEGLFGFLKNGE